VFLAAKIFLFHFVNANPEKDCFAKRCAHASVSLRAVCNFCRKIFYVRKCGAYVGMQGNAVNHTFDICDSLRLFKSSDNICDSPLAEQLIRQSFENNQDEVSVAFTDTEK